MEGSIGTKSRTDWSRAGGVGGAIYWGATASTSLSFGDAAKGFATSIGGGALAGVAAAEGGAAIAEGFFVSGTSAIFGGGAIGDTVSNWGAGNDFDPYRALTAGVLNVAGQGLGEVLGAPISRYSSSIVARSGVLQEFAKDELKAQIRSGIGGFLFGLSGSYVNDRVNEPPPQPSGLQPCPTEKGARLK